MIRRLARIGTAIDRAFTAVAALALALLTLLIVADVSLRYGIGRPIFFAHDVVVLYLTPALFFFGFGPTHWRREHLAVDILTTRLPPRGQALSDLLTNAIGLFVFGILLFVSWERFAKSFAAGERIASIVPWPAWASYALVPVGTAALVAVCAIRLLGAMRTIATGVPEDRA